MTSALYFSRVAEDWDIMSRTFFTEEVREGAYRAAAISTDDIFATAADIGAGTGFITEGLVKRGLNVVAVDPVPEMLDALSRKPYARGSVECRIGAAEALPIEDGSVEFAFANMALHHVEEPARAIAEMFRVLKPRGRAVITDLDTHANEVLAREHNDRWMGLAREDLRRWLADAGFTDVAVGSVGQCCRPAGDGGIGIFVASGRRS